MSYGCLTVPRLFNFRCPDDLLSAIADRAKETGKTQSQIMIDALRQYLDLSAPGGDLQDIYNRLTELTDRVALLEASPSIRDDGGTDTILSRRVDLLERSIADWGRKFTEIALGSPSASQPVQSEVLSDLPSVQTDSAGTAPAIGESDQEPVATPLDPSELSCGLNQKQLCIRLDLNHRQFARDAARHGGKIEYIKAKTGTDWKFVDGRYYPVGNHDNRYDHLAR